MHSMQQRVHLEQFPDHAHKACSQDNNPGHEAHRKEGPQEVMLLNSEHRISDTNMTQMTMACPIEQSMMNTPVCIHIWHGTKPGSRYHRRRHTGCHGAFALKIVIGIRKRGLRSHIRHEMEWLEMKFNQVMLNLLLRKLTVIDRFASLLLSVVSRCLKSNVFLFNKREIHFMPLCLMPNLSKSSVSNYYYG